MTVGIVAALIECGANPQAINRRRQSTVDVSLNDSVSSTIKVAATQVVRIVRTLKYLQSEQNKVWQLVDKLACCLSCGIGQVYNKLVTSIIQSYVSFG